MTDYEPEELRRHAADHRDDLVLRLGGNPQGRQQSRSSGKASRDVTSAHLR